MDAKVAKEAADGKSSGKADAKMGKKALEMPIKRPAASNEASPGLESTENAKAARK